MSKYIFLFLLITNMFGESNITLYNPNVDCLVLVDVNSIAVVTGELDEFGNKIKGISEISVPPLKIRPVAGTI